MDVDHPGARVTAKDIREQYETRRKAALVVEPAAAVENPLAVRADAYAAAEGVDLHRLVNGFEDDVALQDTVAHFADPARPRPAVYQLPVSFSQCQRLMTATEMGNSARRNSRLGSNSRSKLRVDMSS